MWWAWVGLLAVEAGVWAALGTVVVAAVTVGGSVFVARRNTSGSAKQTDAATLWTAYDKHLERLENDNRELRAEVRTVREREGALRERVAVLERETSRIPDLEREVERLRGIVNGA